MNKEEEDAVVSSPPAKRRSSRKMGPRAPTKKVRLDDPPISSQSGLDDSAVAGAPKLDTPAIPISKATSNINRFNALVKRGLCEQEDGSYVYEPVATAKYITQLPIFENRKYELIEEDVQLYDINLPNGKVRAWNLSARDSNHHDSGIVELFRLAESGSRKSWKDNEGNWMYGPFPVPQNNAITDKVCGSVAEAIRLGRICCDIMNRVPISLGLET
ncbi:hypothetical protein LTR08_002543 [Meristemomyces frigidus]|nr:hypothetical protein LTR08_002543 [Meristemomyces frigidus]